MRFAVHKTAMEKVSFFFSFFLNLTTHANDNDDEISISTRGLCILYITLIARKMSKPDDGRYRPKHVVFYC